MYQPQNICDAFQGGGEDWEAVDALIRIENRIWGAAVDDSGEFTQAYFDAYDIVHRLKDLFWDSDPI